MPKAPSKTASLGRSFASASEATIGAELRVLDGPDAGQRVTLGRDAVLVGSGEDCQLVLQDRAVSRRHASFAIAGGRVLVSDLGSKNGTRYLGARVQSMALPIGASIQLGRTTLGVVSSADRAFELSDKTELCGLFGASVAMRRLFADLERVAPSDAPVLIQGETGTGKEGVARAIHQLSKRSRAKLCVFDCGAIQRELVQSALF